MVPNRDQIEIWISWLIYASFLAFAWFLLNPEHPMSVRVAIAGILIGVISAAIATTVLGGKWALLTLFIMVFSGPQLVLLLSSKATLQRVLQSLINRLDKDQ